MGWEPKIVVIACNWCTYAAADLAGSLRYSYPPTAHIIRVPCSGRVEPEFIVKALINGADAVLIGGCHPGDCHYRSGNYKALRRFKLLKRVLEELGIEEERIRLEWISGSEAKKFAEVITELDAKIRELGPNPIKRGV
ncbi:MAG: hydrogenase iron-sulfur subunit [Thermodesulfobacteriaceae bacterium]|nr:hydrogenase iron-sulfur subunit [Thermodesulfobacteriaceae bacterium]MDW8135721.1 hydrogenase iron-sulfur subunit [Thermodesulfobacterium sp.]